MHHSIWKILFVLDANEYLEKLAGKIRKCLFFYVKILKNISVFSVLIWPASTNLDFTRRPHNDFLPWGYNGYTRHSKICDDWILFYFTVRITKLLSRSLWNGLVRPFYWNFDLFYTSGVRVDIENECKFCHEILVKRKSYIHS